MAVHLDPEGLHITRNALVTGGLMTVDLAPTTVRDPIMRSWRRCVSAAIPSEQLRPKRFEHHQSSGLLDRAAAPVLDRLRDELSDLGVAVILTNRSGRISARRVADARQRDRLDDNYVVEGFDYSEHTMGTNGLGTALEEKKPVWVHGAEHFSDALQVFACVGVPIFSAQGSVVGSLSLAATAAASNPMMMPLTKLAARQIEQELRELSCARQTALVSAFAQRSRSRDRPSMLLTDDSVLSDMSLLPLMNPASHVTLWETIQQHTWTSQTAAFVVTLGGIEVTLDARRIEDADGPAYLLKFPPGTAGHERFGSPPTISERTRPAAHIHIVPEISDRVLTAAGTANMLALSGPQGSGRLHVASQLALATGRELLVLDAAVLGGAPFHDWLSRAARAVGDGQCVVIRHAEDLTAQSFAALETIMFELDRGGLDAARPVGQLVATIDRARASETVLRLLDRFAVTVDLPALVEIRNAIPALADTILASVAEARSPNRLSSSALQSLMRFDWPGNVRELRTVLLSAAASACGPVIQTDDLPARLVEAHRSASLSGIERAERVAIVGALAKWRGNRTRAAQDLGIARNTLYRKMRELKITNEGDRLE